MTKLDKEIPPTRYVLQVMALAVVHFVTAVWLSGVFFGLWTRFGEIDYAWTNIAWLAGGLLLGAGGGLGIIGVFLMLAGSGLAAFTAAECLITRPRFGPWAWRLWLSLGLWLVWVPAPVSATLTYWHTVAY
jgi:hypothetical protein